MNVTNKEAKRFLKLVDPVYRSNARKFLSNKNVFFIRVVIKAKGNEARHNGYGYTVQLINVKEARKVKSTGAYDMFDTKLSTIEFNSEITYFEEDDAAFIVSFISRHFKNLKLIFSSSEVHIFTADIGGTFASVRDSWCCYIDGHIVKCLVVDLLCQDGYRIASFDLAEKDVEISDDVWNVILDDRNNVNCILSAYVHEKYYFSDNIKKRIQAVYDSLTDSEKLLFELDEDI